MCLGVKHTIMMGESARDEAQWLPSALSLWGLYLCRSYECSKPCLKRKKNAKLSPQDNIKKVLKCRCLKCPCIVHLDLICMSYDQKKGQRQIGNLILDHKSLKRKGQMRSNWGHNRHCWKDLFEGYKIFPSHFQNKLDLRNIWTTKVLGQQESQFWDSHLGFQGKMTFGCNPHGETLNIL